MQAQLRVGAENKKKVLFGLPDRTLYVRDAYVVIFATAVVTAILHARRVKFKS